MLLQYTGLVIVKKDGTRVVLHLGGSLTYSCFEFPANTASTSATLRLGGMYFIRGGVRIAKIVVGHSLVGYPGF